jgi:aryl-alcohol dehydrogenase-like predicted oxidoreductase
MGLTGAYNSPLDDEAGIAVIAHAFSRGVTLFDTSDVYGPLTNEILLGKVRSRFP